MDPLLVGLIALGSTIFLLAIRVPIAAALGISASIGVFIIFAWRPGAEFMPQYAWRPTLSLIANGPYDFLKSYSLATVPLFILMGTCPMRRGSPPISTAPRACGWRACRGVSPWRRSWDVAGFRPSPDRRWPAPPRWGGSPSRRC